MVAHGGESPPLKANAHRHVPLLNGSFGVYSLHG